MNREQILDLIDKNICFEDLNKAGKLLQKNYEINTTRMEAEDVKISLQKSRPVAIKDKLIIGYNDLKKSFETSDNDFIKIERPIEAIEIIEALPEREYFAIVGRNEWGEINDFHNIIGSLRLGEIYLPKHSAIFNFISPTEQEKKEKIQSVLNGVQINIYEREKYVDNCLHEIGHLFWRTCTRFEEKMQFKELHKYLRQSCIYEYEWERKDAEEVFCTIYKWYMKSVLMNKSFYNILEYEEPQGLKILQQIFNRIAKERIIDDIWEMSKDDVLQYLNPPLDRTTGKYIRKSGMFNKIKDIELPESILNQIESVQEGVPYIALGKAIVPVCGNMIDFEKAKYLSKKPDGKGGWVYTYPKDTKGREKKTEEKKEERKVDQTETPEFKKWFGDSKVVDSNGKPLIVYHGTPYGNIKEFDKSKISNADLHAFFFTPDKKYAESYASAEMKNREGTASGKFDKENSSPKIISSYIKLENPIIFHDKASEKIKQWYKEKEYYVDSYMQDDFENINNEHFINMAIDDELYKITPEERDEKFKKFLEKNKNIEDDLKIIEFEKLLYNEASKKITDELKNIGYDGFIRSEDIDASVDKMFLPNAFKRINNPNRYAYAVFEPNQIKSATGNRGTFDPNSADMTKALPVEGKGRYMTYDDVKSFENNPTIFLDMDGVITWFSEAYKTAFDRDVFKDDSFTVTQLCLQQPRFFRDIPVLERGKELYDRLAKKYNVIFLTTAMDELEYCRADKLAWLKENICENPTVIFSDNKADYAHSETDILIDDMKHNLDSFYEAGGTAIDFTKLDNDEIMYKIAETLNPQQIIRAVKDQLKSMQVETEPTERQKETGNYSKGRIIFKQIPVTIENPKGSIRSGIGQNGVRWLSKMNSHYGYIQGTEGNDFDPIDCFIGDDLGSTKVFIVNQGFNNLFDEHKVMLGYSDIESAKQAFLKCYEKGWERNIMSIGITNTKRFREWLKDGVKTEPFNGDK